MSVVGCHAHALSLPVDMQGFDKGTQSKGQAKIRFRKAPKTENVYIKLLVKVSLEGPSHLHKVTKLSSITVVSGRGSRELRRSESDSGVL